MMKIKILARVVVYDRTNRKILLVKNKGMGFWYAPGGGWEYENETILECAKREVLEETGLRADIGKLLYMQEFHESSESIFFETFFLAEPTHDVSLDKNHVDLDPNGKVEKAEWFGREDLRELKVFPKRLKDTFWDNINSLLDREDAFIGVS